MYQIEVVHNGSTATKTASTINELTTWFNLTNQIDKLLNQDDIVGLSIDGTPLFFSVYCIKPRGKTY